MHYYDDNGNPRHEVIGANGKKRPTIITDARKLNLHPSVTTVLDIKAKPGLITWFNNEILEAVLENPFHPLEFEIDEWKKLVLDASKTKTKKAQDRGTHIHNLLEKYYKTGIIGKKDEKFLLPAIQLIDETFPHHIWKSETNFARRDLGFGGCVDLYCDGSADFDYGGTPIIIDFKTKENAEIKKIKQYDDHHLQLAAYQLGLILPENTRRFNLFISTHEDTPGECHLIESPEKNFEKYTQSFLLLNAFWHCINNYFPEGYTLWKL